MPTKQPPPRPNIWDNLDTAQATNPRALAALLAIYAVEEAYGQHADDATFARYMDIAELAVAVACESVGAPRTWQEVAQRGRDFSDIIAHGPRIAQLEEQIAEGGIDCPLPPYLIAEIESLGGVVDLETGRIVDVWSDDDNPTTD